MISAYGFTSDPVYVIADGFMPDNEIDTYTVPGLNVSTGLEGVGHIVFCKTRGCNLKFYEWYVETFLIPFVKGIRARHKLAENSFL